MLRAKRYAERRSGQRTGGFVYYGGSQFAAGIDSGLRGVWLHLPDGPIEFALVEVGEAVGVGARVLHDQSVEACVDELLHTLSR